MDPKVDIKLLGQPAVLVSGEVVRGFRSHKDLWLILYLGLRKGEPQDREHLASVLWPDQSDAQAKSNLRHSLWRLRRQLGPAATVVVSDTRSVCVSEADVDALRFEILAASEVLPSWLHAVELWAGEPLAGVTDDWADPARQRLVFCYRRLLDRLSTRLIAEGRDREALPFIERLVELDPLDEAVRRRAITASGVIGDVSEAKRHYRDLARLLRQELDVDPEAETQRVLRLAVEGEPSEYMPLDPPVSDESLAFIGREAEISTFRHLLTNVVGGQPGGLLIGGPAGIGKTRLAVEYMDIARRQGVRAVRVAAGQLASEPPFVIWADVLRQLLASQHPQALDGVPEVWFEYLEAILPETRLLRPSHSRLASSPSRPTPGLFHAVQIVLQALTASRPVLLVLDDMQWADPDSLNLFRYLLSKMHPQRLLLLGIFRSEEMKPHEMVGTIPESSGIVTLELQPLSHDHMSHLVRNALQDIDAGKPRGFEGRSAAISRVVAESAGNPLFAIELIRWVNTENPHTMPPTIHKLAESRLEKLSPEARQAIQISAVLGSHFDPADLASVLDDNDLSVLRNIDEAERVGLIHPEEDGYSFSHHQIREAVYRSLPSSTRMMLHRRVGHALVRSIDRADLKDQALIDERGLVEVLAHHFEQGGDRAKSVEYAELAGDSARLVYANAAAEQHYRDVIGLLSKKPVGVNVARILVKLASVLAGQGRYDAALAELDEAEAIYRAIGDGEELASVASLVGLVHADRATPKQGLDHIESMLQSGELHDVSLGAQARIQSTLSILFQGYGQYGKQLEAAESAVELASISAEASLEAEAKSQQGLALLNLGRFDEGLAVLEGTLKEPAALEDPLILSSILSNAAWVHEMQGNMDRSLEYLGRALRLAERRADPAQISFLEYALARNLFYLGRWQESLVRIEKAMALSQSTGQSWAAPYPITMLGQLRLALDDRIGARRLLEESVALARQSGDLQAERSAQRALAEADLLDKKPQEAVNRLAPLVDRGDMHESDATPLLPLLSLAALAMNNHHEAAQFSLQALERALTEGNRRVQARALLAHGVVESSLSQWQRAEDDIERGLEIVREIKFPQLEARLLSQLAIIYRGTAREQGAKLLDEDSRRLVNRLRSGFQGIGVGRAGSSS